MSAGVIERRCPRGRWTYDRSGRCHHCIEVSNREELVADREAIS